jgi:hypothetical protein
MAKASDKVVLGATEIKNLKDMLMSSDKDNQQIAFLAMENCSLAASAPALYLLIKFGNLSPEDMKKACPKTIKKLIEKKYLKKNDNGYELPSMGMMYHVLIQQKAPMDVMECFLDFHGEYLLDTMKAWGYPVDKLNIKVTLKDV